MATPGGMLQTPIHGWRLKEHNTSALEDMEYTPNELSTLDLDVNDPSRVDEAIAVLKETTSLFDQCDLLQYLKAVRGADFGIEGAGGTADELLNEVYKKSVRLGLWNVARQAAGLLRKSPNGLSYHVIDLLVRGLPISVGRGASEYSISSTGRGMKEQADAPSSLNSDTLRDLVLDHASEPREGPVLFEIIVALADASRSQPALFEGVARLRISLIYDAMVREIGRTYGVPAQEANERLMILSPTELRHLLRRLLETHESRVVQRTVTPIHIRTEKLEKSGLLKPESELAAENGAVPTVEDGPAPVMSPNTRVSKLPKKMQVIARSAGEASGNFASVDVLVDGEPKSLPDTLVVAPFSRGLVVVVIDSTLGLITFGGLFDTHASSAEAEDLGAFLEDLREGEIVALACKDDCSEHLDVKVKEVIARKLGSKAVHSIGFRDSWCLVATLGEPESCRESHVPAAERNPAGPVVLAVDMAEARERIDFLQLADKESFCTSKSLAMIAPTLGECYRKRAVDGALNRVPNNGFYKKVRRPD